MLKLKASVQFFLTGFVVPLAAFCQQISVSPVPEETYVGNVYGSVIDAVSKTPIAGAQVTLVDQPVGRRIGHPGFATRSNKGLILLPPRLTESRLIAYTDDGGQFVIAGVPTPFPLKRYTIVVTASGYDSMVVDYVPVLPGASMALRTEFKLTTGRDAATLFDGTDVDAPVYYGHESKYTPPTEADMLAPSQLLPRATASGNSPFTAQVYATQEGDIGLTTANSHVIRAGDVFVALPSRRALSSKDGREFQVQIQAGKASVIAPVWDIGPWNTRDDYWNPATVRDMWRDLPQGEPEAQAAIQSHYNGQHDDSGRTVPNAAGIDLGSGTATALGLKLNANAWVQVQFLWTAGKADFSLSGPASTLSVVQGKTVTTSISEKSIDGFSAFVTLSASNLPKNTTANFSGNTSSLPTGAVIPNGQLNSTLSIATGPNTPIGTTTVTINGTISGALSRSTSLALKVLPPPLSASSSCPSFVTLGGSFTFSLSVSGGVGPFSYSVNGQSQGNPTTLRPSTTGIFTASGTVTDSAGQQATSACQVRVFAPITASCAATPNPVKINKTATWQAQSSGGSGSYSYNWLNGTTTQAYSKSYTTAQTVSNNVQITDRTTGTKQTAACSLSVTK